MAESKFGMFIQVNPYVNFVNLQKQFGVLLLKKRRL